MDITAVDWPKRAERFDVVYILYSFARNERVRIKINIPLGYQPETAVGEMPAVRKAPGRRVLISTLPCR